MYLHKLFIFLFFISQQSFAFYEHPDTECRVLGEIAKAMVIDRSNGISYASTLSSAGVALSSLNGRTRREGMQEMTSIINLIYIKMPQLSPDGAYKLVALSCVYDSNKIRKK